MDPATGGFNPKLFTPPLSHIEKDKGIGRNTLTHYHSMDWLSPELKDVIDASSPKASNIDSDGNVSKESLALAVEKVFHKSFQYYNFYQLLQCVQCFASAWGFHVSVYDKNIECAAKK